MATGFEATVVLLLLIIGLICGYLLAEWLMCSGGKELNSFQIHDDCPEWFLKNVNRELDRIIKGNGDAALS